MKIGVFDSGVGGLSLLAKALVHPLLQCEFIYYADTKNVPYSYKSTNEIKQYVFKAVDDLLALEVDAIVLACNTATSVAVKELREKVGIPIIGMEPAIKPALENLVEDKFSLVTATPVTLKLEKFNLLLERLSGENRIFFAPLPGLVELAESENFDSIEVSSYLEVALGKVDRKKVHNIVLGCTHFIFFKEQLTRFFPDSTEFFDGIDGTIKQLISKLPDSLEKCAAQQIEFYESGQIITNERRAFYERLLLRLRENNGYA